MCIAPMVLLKGNVAHARNFIAIYESVSSLLSAFQACVLHPDFQLLEIKTIASRQRK